jgi:hypothetical protein
MRYVWTILLVAAIGGCSWVIIPGNDADLFVMINATTNADAKVPVQLGPGSIPSLP